MTGIWAGLARTLKAALTRPKVRVFVSQKAGYRLSLSNGGAKFLRHVFILRPNDPSARALSRILSDKSNPRFKEVRSFEEAQEQLQEWGAKRPDVVALQKTKADAEKSLAALGH